MHLTAPRIAGVIVLAALAFAAAYLLAPSDKTTASEPSRGLQKLSFPSPAVALPKRNPGSLPSLARAPRPVRRRPSVAAPPAAVAPAPGIAPAPAPGPAPPPSGGGGGGGGGGGIIIEG